MRAIWNGKVIAESSKAINTERNQYFPPDTVHKKFLASSETHTVCPWKGTVSYYNAMVDDKFNKDAAWYYPVPSSLASKI